VNSKASDLVEMLERITTVKESPLLTDSQRQVILKDLAHDLPLEMFSSTFRGSRDIIKSLLEESRNDGSKETKSESKSTTQTKGLSPKSAQEESPSGDDENPRGSSVKATVGKQTQKKPRQAKGSSRRLS